MKQSVFTLFVLLLYMQLIAHIKVEFTVSVYIYLITIHDPKTKNATCYC